MEAGAGRPGGPRWLAAAAALIAAAFLAALAWPLSGGRVYVEDDLGAFHLPLRAFYQACLRSGDSFLWMPHLFNGFYVHGEGQAGMLHPLHWLLYRWLPLERAFMLELWLSYPFALAGMALFLRRWGLDWAAALFGGFLFAFAGAQLNHYIHLHFVAILAHLPWQLLAIDAAMRATRPRAAAWGVCAAAALSASQLLLGLPQAVYLSWLAELLYAAALWVGRPRFWALAGLGAAKCCAALMAMAQLLPTQEALSLSMRAAVDRDFQVAISLHPLNLLQFANPYLFQRRVFAPILGDEPWDAPYIGAGVAAAILLYLCRPRPRGDGRRFPLLVWFGLGLAGLGLMAALGGYGPWPYVAEHIPFVNKFRAPARHIALTHFGLAIVAAHALAWLAGLGGAGPAPWRRIAPVIALPAAALGAALWLASPPEAIAHLTMAPRALFAGAALAAVGAALAGFAARGHALGLAALLVFTALDLGAYGLRHKPSMTLEAYRATVPLPPAAPFARIDPDIHPYFMNRYAVHGYRVVYGYAALYPDRRLDYTRPEALRLAGVSWRQARLVATPEVAAAAAEGASWLPVEGAAPRVWLTAEAKAAEDPAAALAAGLDPLRTALVPAPIELPPGAPGTAAVVEERPGRISVTARAPAARLLIVNESHHPGWRVRVNGEAGTPLRVFGDFMGCVVPTGESQVVFAFEPDSYRRGLRWSLAGAALTALLAAGMFLGPGAFARRHGAG